MLNECSGDIVVSNLLKQTDITKSFAGVRALRGVSFDLGAGEVHALVGENDAATWLKTRGQ